MVARLAHNQKVAGSNPALATKFVRVREQHGDCRAHDGPCSWFDSSLHVQGRLSRTKLSPDRWQSGNAAGCYPVTPQGVSGSIPDLSASNPPSVQGALGGNVQFGPADGLLDFQPVLPRCAGADAKDKLGRESRLG